MSVTYPEIKTDFIPHWIENLSSEEYHADQTSVSSTGLRKILKSEHSFFADRFPDAPRIETDALRLGSAIHMALLEPDEFKNRFVIAPEFAGKGARTAKQEWYDQQSKGAVIFKKQEEYDDLRRIVDSVMTHKHAELLLRTGTPEISGYYTDPETGIKCRIRPDLLNEKYGCFVDVKSTRDECTLESFQRTIWQRRYDFQMAMYQEGIEIIGGKKFDTLFLVIEKNYPFECALFIADDPLLLRGKTDYNNALRTLKRCIDNRSWQRASGVRPISLPRWVSTEKENINEE